MKKIKFLNRSAKEVSSSLNEVRILASISNPYVLAYKEAFYEEEEGCLVMITEFASGGDLSAVIKDYKRQKMIFAEE
jgi:serine/threonine protein kinase